MRTSPFSLGIAVAGALVSLLGAGCGPSQAPGDADTAEVTVALTTVPATITCIRVHGTIAGQPLAPVGAIVTPNATSVSVSFGRLPAGPATLSGAAYALACTDPTIGTATPLWLSDTVSTTLVTGANNTVALKFHQNNPVTVNANFIKNVSSLATGQRATYAIMADGSVKVSGSASLGIGTVLVPTDLTGATSVAEVAGGGNFGCLRTTAGAVSCWGLQPGAPSSTPAPTAVALPFPALQLVAVSSHICAILQQSGTNNPVYCWGVNSSGQLGNGTFTTSTTPLLITLPSGESAVTIAAGGDTTCAVSTTSRLSCWGRGATGQLGNGVLANQSIPSVVSGFPGITKLAVGGGHVCALRGDGSLWCWGAAGLVGDGTNMQRNTPVVVPSLSDVVAVAAGASHTCALRKNGEVSCWGLGHLGQTAIGTGITTFTPSLVQSLKMPAVGLAAHEGNHSCALLADGSAVCWGANEAGQVGDGTITPRFVPTPIKVM